MNDKVKEIAEDIRKQSNIPEEEQFGSVIAILMIISIILTVIRVIQECNKTKLSSLSTSEDKTVFYEQEIRTLSIKRGWFTKMRMKKLIRNSMSRDQYKTYGASLLDAILIKGETIKDDEVITLMEAANV